MKGEKWKETFPFRMRNARFFLQRSSFSRASLSARIRKILCVVALRFFFVCFFLAFVPLTFLLHSPFPLRINFFFIVFFLNPSSHPIAPFQIAKFIADFITHESKRTSTHTRRNAVSHVAHKTFRSRGKRKLRCF